MVGDMTPADGVSKERKRQLEKLAFKYYASEHSDGEQLAKLWEEYEENTNEVAQFVRGVSRLQRLDKAFTYAQKYSQCDLTDFKQDAEAIKHPQLKSEAEKLLNQWTEWDNRTSESTCRYLLVIGKWPPPDTHLVKTLLSPERRARCWKGYPMWPGIRGFKCPSSLRW
jgi:hypothetical protein